MHDKSHYVERIKVIALERDGAELSDDEAYERLVRLVPLVKVVYQPTEKIRYERRNQ